MKLVSITPSLRHSWASAFRHPVSQSGTGAFRYRTGSPYSGTGLVPASALLFIPVPDWLDAGQSDIPAFTYDLSTLQSELNTTTTMFSNYPPSVLCTAFVNARPSGIRSVRYQNKKRMQKPELVRSRNNGTQSGTGMLRYRTEMLNCRCPADANKFSWEQWDLFWVD